MKKQLLLLFTLCFSLLVGYQFTGTTVTLDTENVQTVKVQPGDTIWSIAERASGSHEIDIRDMVYNVKHLNHISDSGTLKPGRSIKVPTVKTVSPLLSTDYLAKN